MLKNTSLSSCKKAGKKVLIILVETEELVAWWEWLDKEEVVEDERGSGGINTYASGKAGCLPIMYTYH